MNHTYRSDRRMPLLPSYHVDWGVMDWVFVGLCGILALTLLTLPIWINYL